ncbi:LysE family transporter [Devosia psychrophila]|uniref:LysE family transporter n=1 Tax=Devosia psychrophila TaxID=728005 RepID=UPI003139E7A2
MARQRAVERRSRRDRRAFLCEGLITNRLNPKAFMFYAAVLPTLLDPASSPSWQALTSQRSMCWSRPLCTQLSSRWPAS